MKKIITLIAAAAMLAISCQKENTPAGKDSNSPVEGKLTATIVKTKVSYTETEAKDLQPAWEIGDKIIGFDDAGKTYTLSVASVSAETATLSGTVPDGPLHLIYKSGAKATDISSKSLAIDYTAQKGDKTMPAVMLADGTVESGACDFQFVNAGAIIGISAVNGVPSGSTISKITVEGENLSAATVALDGSTLVLTATTAKSDAISTATLSGITTIAANGTLSSPVFIAVPAGAKIAKVSAFVPKEPETMKIPSTAAEKEGIDYVTIAGIKWAKWNVGANSEMDYGWYFPWAGAEGYILYPNAYPYTWQLAKAKYAEYSYSPSSAKLASACDYVYVKTQRFKGYLFDYEYTPYHSGSDANTGWAKYIPTGMSSFWSGEGSPDNKSVLDPEDDAAIVNWGGTWRMPTSAEISALYNATFWAWDETDAGYYVFAPDAIHKAGTGLHYFPNDLSKSSALLFFPATGYGYTDKCEYSGSIYGDAAIWSSDLYLYDPYLAYGLSVRVTFYQISIDPRNLKHRCYGLVVRPVSD